MQLKVLYLDDEPALCMIFSDEFSSPKIQIETFTDAQKAIEYARINPPDVAFLDNRLPGTNGEKVAQAMSPSIPKYLITGDNSINTSYKFLAIFNKPMPVEEVRKVLDSMLSQVSSAQPTN